MSGYCPPYRGWEIGSYPDFTTFKGMTLRSLIKAFMGCRRSITKSQRKYFTIVSFLTMLMFVEVSQCGGWTKSFMLRVCRV